MNNIEFEVRFMQPLYETKKMTIKEIAKYIVRNDPYSCMAVNDILAVYGDDEDELIEEILTYFAYEKLGLCGCGRPEDTWEVIRRVLKLYHIRRTDTEMTYEQFVIMHKESLGIDYDDSIGNGILQFILYTLDNKGLLDHGSSIGSAWLTDEGQMYLTVLDIWHVKREEEKDGRK